MPKTAKKAKQQFIPGAEPPSVPEIDKAAEVYYQAMTERQALTKEEVDAKTNLISVMQEHGLAFYETPDELVVNLLDKKNVKCKKKHAGGNGDGE